MQPLSPLYDLQRMRLRALYAHKHYSKVQLRSLLSTTILVPKTLGLYRCTSEIDYDLLPPKCVMKASNLAQTAVIIDKRNCHELTSNPWYVRFQEKVTTMSTMRNKHDAFSAYVQYIIPHIVVEEYIEDYDNEVYDVFCTKSKIVCCTMHLNKTCDNIFFFDSSARCVSHDDSLVNCDQKANLAKVLGFVCQLAKQVPVTKIRLCAIGQKIYVRGLHFHPVENFECYLRYLEIQRASDMQVQNANVPITMCLTSNDKSQHAMHIKCKGGLCNKLLHLFSACQLAVEQNISILEPNFGWKEKFRFGTLYSIKAFNDGMRHLFRGRDIMIPQNRSHEFKIVKNEVHLWSLYSKYIYYVRRRSQLASDSLHVVALQALQLCEPYAEIIKEFLDIDKMIGVHFRIESDWRLYSKRIARKRPDIAIFVPAPQIVEMVRKQWNNVRHVFFSCGETQEQVSRELEAREFTPTHYFNKDFEYEVNAAINFDILCQCKYFVGTTRSSFTNMICLHRAMQEKDCYIYNHGDELAQRIDYGIHCTPAAAVTKKGSVILQSKVVQRDDDEENTKMGSDATQEQRFVKKVILEVCNQNPHSS